MRELTYDCRKLSPFDYFTDKINVSSIIHSTLDILGTLPGGGIFDIMNAGYYLLERNYKEAIKSLVFAIPGFDLMKTSSKLAVKGGRLSSAAAQVLSTLNTMDMLACVYYAASDFGNDMAYLIYKYGYEKAAFSADTWVELLSITAHGIQLGHYSNPFMDTELTPYFEEALSELNPNKGFINFGSGEGGNKTIIPDKAKDIANQVKANNGVAPKGYKGGKVYQNMPKEGGQKLPEGIRYKEYDINPYVKGENRGAERIVIGDDGSVWYTNNHYITFTKIQ